MPQEVPAALSPRRFRRGVLLTGSGTVLQILFLFLETMIAVRLLSPRHYGVYVLLIAFVNLLVTVADFGTKTAVTQLIAGSDRARQLHISGTALLFRLFVVALLALGAWLGQGLLRLWDPSGALQHYATWVPVLLLVTSVDELLFGLLQGFQAYRQMAISQVIRSVLRLLLTLLFLFYFAWGVSGLLLSWILSFTASTLYQLWALPVSRRFVYRQPVLSELLRFGFPLQLTRLLWFVFFRINVVLLGVLAGPASVALYEVAARIPDALQRLSESYISVYFPTLSSLLSEGRRAEASRMLNESLRMLSFATGLVALVAVLFSREIVTVLFSAKYAASSSAFALLMIAFHMTFIVNLMGYTLVGAGYPGRSLATNVARTTVNVIADLLLIPLFGFVGPAYAALVSNSISIPLSVRLLVRSRVSVANAPYITQTLSLLVLAALYWWWLPRHWVAQVATLLLFVAFNLVLGTVSLRDWTLVIPATIRKRVQVGKESFQGVSGDV